MVEIRTGQVTTETYGDSTIGQVSFTYGDALGRLTAKSELLGASQYSYVAMDGTSPGAGKLREVNGPLQNDTLRYSYDWQNRQTKTELLADGTQTVLWSEETTLDSLGRMVSLEDGLGSTSFSYAGNTSMVEEVTSPNGVKVAYEYYPLSAMDGLALRLKKISNLVGSTEISGFEYNYDVSGRITEWKQKQGSTEANLALAYNLSSELIEAVVTDGSSAVLSERGWRYDPAINRIAEFTETSTIPAYYNTLNQLKRIGGSGRTLVRERSTSPAR